MSLIRRYLCLAPCILASTSRACSPKEKIVGNRSVPFHKSGNRWMMSSPKNLSRASEDTRPRVHEEGEDGRDVYTNISTLRPSPPPMAMWNGALRFGLEVASLVGLAHFGWTTAAVVAAWAKPVGGVTLPVLAAAAWGIWNVPTDPSRGGGAPIPVSGITRLGIEAVVLGCGAASLCVWDPVAGSVFAVGTFVHYTCYYQRIQWLLRQDGR